MEYKVRRATIDDLASITALNAALFREEYDCGHDNELDLSYPQSDKGQEYYKRALTGSHYATFIAQSASGEIVGYIIGKAENLWGYRKVKTGALENMYVVHNVRRSGVGKALVRELFSWLKTRGFNRCFVSAYVKNTVAADFYMSQGFAPWEVGFEAEL
jgi:diamine N-acetyltransferase